MDKAEDVGFKDEPDSRKKISGIAFSGKNINFGPDYRNIGPVITCKLRATNFSAEECGRLLMHGQEDPQ